MCSGVGGGCHDDDGGVGDALLKNPSNIAINHNDYDRQTSHVIYVPH